MPKEKKLSSEELKEKKLLIEYVKSLNDKETIAYKIAITNLESSFSLEKSIGFLQWKNQNK
jgi:hypothetical protein